MKRYLPLLTTVTLITAINPKDYPLPPEGQPVSVTKAWSDILLQGVSIPDLPTRPLGSPTDVSPDVLSCLDSNTWAPTYGLYCVFLL